MIPLATKAGEVGSWEYLILTLTRTDGVRGMRVISLAPRGRGNRVTFEQFAFSSTNTDDCVTGCCLTLPSTVNCVAVTSSR